MKLKRSQIDKQSEPVNEWHVCVIDRKKKLCDNGKCPIRCTNIL